MVNWRKSEIVNDFSKGLNCFYSLCFRGIFCWDIIQNKNKYFSFAGKLFSSKRFSFKGSSKTGCWPVITETIWTHQWEDHCQSVHADHCKSLHDDHCQSVHDDHWQSLYDDHWQSVYDDHCQSLHDDHCQSLWSLPEP